MILLLIAVKAKSPEIITKALKLLESAMQFKEALDNNRHRWCTALTFGVPASRSRLTQRETNNYVARCASVLAWSYLAARSPEQLVIDLFEQHQRFAVCCPL